MVRLPTPPVPELLRIDTSSPQAAIDYLKNYFGPSGGGGFNYLPAHIGSYIAHKGEHRLDVLIKSVRLSKNKVGIPHNEAVVSMIAPLAFGRDTMVLPAPRVKYSFGRDRYSSYRLSFLYVESGVVKAYFLQPRKTPFLTPDQFGGLARIVRDNVLAQYFPDEALDIDFVDVSAPADGADRVLQTYDLESVGMWSHERLQRHLTIVLNAIEALESSGYTASKRRPRPLAHPELPLFD